MSMVAFFAHATGSARSADSDGRRTKRTHFAFYLGVTTVLQVNPL